MTCRMQTLLHPLKFHHIWECKFAQKELPHGILRAAFDSLLSSRSFCGDTPGSLWDQCICIQATMVLQLAALTPELLQLLPCLRLHSARWMALQAMSLLAPSCLKLRVSHRWISSRLQSSNEWPWPTMKYMMLDASYPQISLAMSLLAA